MISSLVIFGICILFVIIGFFQTINQLKNISNKVNRVQEFLNNLKLFVESKGNNRNAYSSMIHQSALVQKDIGSYGVFSSYHPPFANYVVHDYQIVVNMPSEIDRWIQNDNVFENGVRGAQMLTEALVRYLGVSDEQQKKSKIILHNPILLFREGISWFLTLPMYVLSFIGLFNENRYDNVRKSRFILFISGLITIIYLIGSAFTIILGWSAFKELISNWF